MTQWYDKEEATERDGKANKAGKGDGGGERLDADCTVWRCKPGRTMLT